MSEVTQENRLRYRAILIAREVKYVFGAVPERFGWIIAEPVKWTLRRVLLRWILRWLFVAKADDKPHRAGEIVLAELRSRAGYNRRSNFTSDSHLLAFREGQRAVVQEVFNYLNLDESTVRKMMELDDGLE